MHSIYTGVTIVRTNVLHVNMLMLDLHAQQTKNSDT